MHIFAEMKIIFPRCVFICTEILQRMKFVTNCQNVRLAVGEVGDRSEVKLMKKTIIRE